MSTFSWTIELRKSLFFGMLCQRNTRRPTENPDLRTFSTDLNLIVLYIKAAPWDDINFCFSFCNEVVYPPDHDYIFFRVFRFLQIFLINISMKPLKTRTYFLYT